MLLFATSVGVQVLALHVCADPEAAGADIVYPALQALQSSAELVPHNVPTDPVATVFVPPGQVQVLAAQVTVLNVRVAAVHVAVPLPLYPASQVTVTAVPPTEPAMALVADLSEFAT